MQKQQPTIEISRHNGSLTIKAIMPTWAKKQDDGSIQILLPHLGGATTFVDSEEEIQNTVNDLFKGFCIMVEKHGNGIEKELELIGWTMVKKHKVNQSILNIQSRQPVYDSMLSTADTRLLKFAM